MVRRERSLESGQKGEKTGGEKRPASGSRILPEEEERERARERERVREREN